MNGTGGRGPVLIVFLMCPPSPHWVQLFIFLLCYIFLTPERVPPYPQPDGSTKAKL